jgi:ApaG protein
VEVVLSDTTTHGIRIQAEPAFVPEHSEPDANKYFFAYRITITNVGGEPAQLISRHWIITTGSGHQEHVRGPGVVGKQPRLDPGESFVYTSFCPLPTPVGTMHGTFQMVRDSGEQFDAEISSFTLAAPYALN